VPIFHTGSEEETIALGKRLARTLPPGATVLLIGNLGAGKTTLAKGIVQGLGAAPADDVSSPTFTLIHEYGTPPAVYHVDLFDSPATVIIEWGERFPELMPLGRIEIRLRALEGDEREIELTEREL
jgi:tRNA threonylcarbamoyladenosine biosynthesis protein TsaE